MSGMQEMSVDLLAVKQEANSRVKSGVMSRHDAERYVAAVKAGASRAVEKGYLSINRDTRLSGLWNGMNHHAIKPDDLFMDLNDHTFYKVDHVEVLLQAYAPVVMIWFTSPIEGDAREWSLNVHTLYQMVADGDLYRVKRA